MMFNEPIIKTPEEKLKVRMCWRDKPIEEACDIVENLKETGLVSKVDVVVEFTNQDFIVVCEEPKKKGV